MSDMVRQAPSVQHDSDSGPFGHEPIEAAAGFVASDDTAPGLVAEGGAVRAPGAAEPPTAVRVTAPIAVGADVGAGEAQVAGPTSVDGGRLQVVTGGRRSRSDVGSETMPETGSGLQNALRRDTSPDMPAADVDDIELLFGDPGDITDPDIATPSAEELQTASATVSGGLSADLAEMDDEAEPTDWKIKAPPGLTYNFHSLDAMLGWAANKSGLDMQVSVDGEDWFEFGSFLEAIRAGLSASRALKIASEGGEVSERIAAITAAPQLSAFDEIQQVDAREVVRRRLAGEAEDDAMFDHDTAEALMGPSDVAAPSEEESGADKDPDQPALDSPEPAAPERRISSPSPVSGQRAPSGPTARAATSVQPEGRRHSGQAQAPGGVQKTPLAAKPKAGLAPVTVVAIFIVLAVIAAGALHFSGLLRIPGLPF